MNKIIFIILKIIYFIILEYLFFGITAKIKGKKCKYNCEECENWACTHLTKQKAFYPCKDWVKWCGKEKRSKK